MRTWIVSWGLKVVLYHRRGDIITLHSDIVVWRDASKCLHHVGVSTWAPRGWTTSRNVIILFRIRGAWIVWKELRSTNCIGVKTKEKTHITWDALSPSPWAKQATVLSLQGARQWMWFCQSQAGMGRHLPCHTSAQYPQLFLPRRSRHYQPQEPSVVPNTI